VNCFINKINTLNNFSQNFIVSIKVSVPLNACAYNLKSIRKKISTNIYTSSDQKTLRPYNNLLNKVINSITKK